MKRTHNDMVGIIVIMSLSISRVTYATVEEDWEKAKVEHTLVAYEAFLQKYADGTFAQEAHKRIGELLDRVLAMACLGQPSDSAALAVSGMHQAKMLMPGVSIALPDTITATTPGDFYYAICLTERTDNLDRCEYSRFGIDTMIASIIPQQIVWKVEIRAVRTGNRVDSTELRGNIPRCPSTAHFETMTEIQYVKGAEPSHAELLNWINKILGIEKQKERISKEKGGSDGKEKFVYVATPLPLYSGPYSQGPILVNMEAGTTLLVIGEEGVWYHVETPNNVTGWVAKGWVRE
jgi:hypothetical protein